MEDSKKFIKFIKSRKSVRNFIFQKIYRDKLLDILECGRWAPSGKNNQAWRVNIVIHSSVKRMLSELTKYGGIIESAYANFAVFLDLERCYDRIKDIQSIGAFMQNLLLGAHAVGLGAVWLGEILNNKEKVNEIFKLSKEKFEFMGIIAIGEIDKEMERMKEQLRESERRPVDDFTDWF